MGTYATIYSENQALESGDLPAQILHTEHIIMGEMGNKQQPFSPLHFSGLSKACVKFDPAMLSAPVMHTLLIYKQAQSKRKEGGGIGPSAILSEPYKVKANLPQLLVMGDNKIMKISDIDNVQTMYDKMAYMDIVIDDLVKRHPFVKEQSSSPTGKDKIVMHEDELGLCLAELEDYIGEDILSTPTPKGFAIRPIGIGGSQRFVNIASVVGYKGRYAYLAPEIPFITGRNPRMWTLATFLRLLKMMPPNCWGEEGLIRASELYEQLIANGIGITTIEDAKQILPWWSRWGVRPSITKLSDMKDIGRFVLRMYVLGRNLSLANASGVNSLIQESRWQWTGTNLPGPALLDSCFRGQYTTAISGIKQKWAWPASSAHLKIGEMQIMGWSTKKRNFWHPMGTVQELKVRPNVIFITDKDFVIPNLNDEGYDAMILSFESNMKRARLEEIYRRESRPPASIYMAEGFGPGAVDKEEDLLTTLLIGGQPLYTWDLLFETPHTVMEYKHFKPGTELSEDIVNREAERREFISDEIEKEDKYADQQKRIKQGVSYIGEEFITFNMPEDSEAGKCPFCGKENIDSRGYKNHVDACRAKKIKEHISNNGE